VGGSLRGDLDVKHCGCMKTLLNSSTYTYFFI
jgi:hypothetical protein